MTRLAAQNLFTKKKGKAKNIYPQGLSLIINRQRTFNGILVKLRKACATISAINK